MECMYTGYLGYIYIYYHYLYYLVIKTRHTRAAPIVIPPRTQHDTLLMSSTLMYNTLTTGHTDHWVWPQGWSLVMAATMLVLSIRQQINE